jgi:hypothetical protein
VLSVTEREDLQRQIEEIEAGKLDIRRGKARAGAAFIVVRERRLWCAGFSTFEDFLVHYAGSRRTGYRWMSIAMTVEALPSAPWLAEQSSVAEELHKLRADPVKQAEIARLASSAEKRDRLAIVKAAVKDPDDRKDLSFDRDVDFHSGVSDLFLGHPRAVIARVEKNTATETPADYHRESIDRVRRALTRGRDAAREAIDAFSPVFATTDERDELLKRSRDLQLLHVDFRRMLLRRATADETEHLVEGGVYE